MRLLLPALFILCVAQPVIAQTTAARDTSATTTLQEVLIKAYGQNRQLKEVSGAINYIGQQQLERFNNTSLLPALNATPGVRMEERSPGSYRLNVRGSTLRSPFGVRNVKVYWNGIPFTDPGGNTYLNQLGYYNFQSVEVIKGPASSLYGAGTGGALLISSEATHFAAGANLDYVTGSFNLQNLHAQVRLGNDSIHQTFDYLHQRSDGYRNHTRLRRDAATWHAQLKATNRQQLEATVLFGDMFYETPGGLTQAEYNANPKAARSNAEALKAGIDQQTFLGALSHWYQLSKELQNTTVMYGAFSRIKNPTFLNYERRNEPHIGGRTVFTWQHSLAGNPLQVLVGGETQLGYFNTKTFKNNAGRPDSLRTDDEITNWIYSGFAQADLQLPRGWFVSTGISLNNSFFKILRLSVPLQKPVERTYSNEWAPRIALSKKITGNVLLYGSISKGFSSPTTAEVLPSTSVISTGLNAEHGINYEAGLKTSWLQQRLYVEVNAFYYQLKNAIVIRRDANNADYYVNAGATRQQGLESQASYQLLTRPHGFVTYARFFASHTWSNFEYADFKKDTINYKGRHLPSVAPHTVAAGFDVTIKPGMYINATWTYTDAIPLNDDNTVKASSYQLAGGRIGWRNGLFKKISGDFFAGVDNLFDVRYSLGNDINAAAGRYFNPAAGRNYFAGIALKFLP